MRCWASRRELDCWFWASRYSLFSIFRSRGAWGKFLINSKKYSFKDTSSIFAPPVKTAPTLTSSYKSNSRADPPQINSTSEWYMDVARSVCQSVRLSVRLSVSVCPSVCDWMLWDWMLWVWILWFYIPARANYIEPRMGRVWPDSSIHV